MAKQKVSTPVAFEIKEHIGVLSESPTGWRKELNIVSWNNSAPKLDVRDWDEDHTHMSRGITLTEEEAMYLAKYIRERE